MTRRTFKVTLEERDDEPDQEYEALAGFGGPELPAWLSRTVELDFELVRENVQETLSSVCAMLEGCELAEGRFAVSQASFSLRFDAQGGVSLLSVASGSVSAQSGLTFTISRIS